MKNFRVVVFVKNFFFLHSAEFFFIFLKLTKDVKNSGSVVAKVSRDDDEIRALKLAVMLCR
jgi:hypothetical protein